MFVVTVMLSENVLTEQLFSAVFAFTSIFGACSRFKYDDCEIFTEINKIDKIDIFEKELY